MDQISFRSRNILEKIQADDTNLAILVGEYFKGLDDGESAPDFPNHLDWVNSKTLSFKESLKGKFVLLDFFTYCCINCMHILPYLHQLEDDVPPEKGLVIIGVHSGKFGNEKSSSNIQNAIRRYKILHPVINDCNYEMWNLYSIICWPTLVLIDPNGNVCLIAVGEGDVKNVVKFVKCAVQLFKTTPFEIADFYQEKENKASSILSYPGKVYYNECSNTTYISDTTNNRVLEINCFGQIISKFDELDLDGPQDLLVFENKLYICDTNHHQVKAVDLISRKMFVVCGTGVQGQDFEGGKTGVKQEISSPWGMEVVNLNTVSQCEGIMLVICMAGTHQLWAYALTDVVIVNKTKTESYAQHIAWRCAGSGVEGNKNNSYPHKANFAQPSGVTFDGEKFLYIADSESSTIRFVELPSFAVKNVAGGEVDPTNLFAFGDVDGKGTAAKLQHPIGVVSIGGTILVADSYNHKVKEINPKTRIVKSIESVMGLAEPSGLAYSKFSRQVYIADTNNHQIKIYNLETDIVKNIDIVDRKNHIKNAGVTFIDSCKGSLKIMLNFKNKLNKDGNSNIKVSCFGEVKCEDEEFAVTTQEVEMPCVNLQHGAVELLITLYTCSDEGACFMNRYCFRINVSAVAVELKESNYVEVDLCS